MVTATLDLPLEMRQQACEIAAELALHNNLLLVVVGQTARDELVICADGCCTVRPGAVVVVPDVECIARWGSVPKNAMSMARADGRTVYVFQGGA